MKSSLGVNPSAPGGEQPYLVTALVSTYKAGRFIHACLDDLVQQTIFPRTEVIVIDSASPENEASVVREFQRLHSNIRYLRTAERETLYAAWNRGIGLATGRFLTNANTDDRHAPHAFEKLAHWLDLHPDYGVVYASTAITDEANSTLAAAPIKGCFKAKPFDRKRLFRECLPGPQPMWRRDLHQQFGLFDPSLLIAGDYEFWLRLSGRVSFGHIPECLGLFLDSPASLMHGETDRMAREMELARERHWPAEWGARQPFRREECESPQRGRGEARSQRDARRVRDA